MVDNQNDVSGLPRFRVRRAACGAFGEMVRRNGSAEWFGERELEEAVEEVPDEEAGEFACEQEEYGPAGAGLVEAEGDCYDVPDEGNPGGECEPDAVFVYIDLLLCEGFRLDLEPFFNPFPFPDPTYPVGEDAAEPVAEGADEEAADRVAGRSEDCEVEGVGTEGEESGGQEGAEKEAEEAETLKEFHMVVGLEIPGQARNDVA